MYNIKCSTSSVSFKNMKILAKALNERTETVQNRFLILKMPSHKRELY